MIQQEQQNPLDKRHTQFLMQGTTTKRKKKTQNLSSLHKSYYIHEKVQKGNKTRNNSEKLKIC